MNSDYFYQFIVDSLCPTDDLTQDTRDIVKVSIMYGISVENIDDVNTANREIERIYKMYLDHYTAKGQLEEFQKAHDEMKKKEKDNIIAATGFMAKVMKHEMGKEPIEIISPTGNPDTDARTFVEKYIKMFDDMKDVCDALYLDYQYKIMFGEIFKLYEEGTPNAETFNAALEKYATELDLEGHQEAKSELGEKIGQLLE